MSRKSLNHVAVKRLPHILLGFGLLLVPACDGGKAAPGASKEGADADAKEGDKVAKPATGANAEGELQAAAPANIEIKPPCESLTKDFVGDTLGWTDTVEGQPASMSEGRTQACTFSRSGSEGGNLAVTINKADARGLEKKYVERAFATDLAREAEENSFTEVTPKLGDQTIMGVGKKGPHHVYQLRWRIGNQVDYLLTLRTRDEQDAAQMQTKLRALAQKL